MVVRLFLKIKSNVKPCYNYVAHVKSKDPVDQQQNPRRALPSKPSTQSSKEKKHCSPSGQGKESQHIPIVNMIYQ